MPEINRLGSMSKKRNKNSRKHKKYRKPLNDFRFIASEIRLSEAGAQTTEEELLRVGRFFDPRYEWFSVTKNMLLSMVNNFKSGAFRQKIFIDINHDHGQGAAAEIVGLRIVGDRLLGELEWSDWGVDMNRSRKLCYLSADYAENFVDNESGQKHGALLKGGGLTIRPVVKGQRSIQLSDSGDSATCRTYINPDLGGANNMNEFQKLLAKLLGKLNLNKDSQKQLSELFTTSAEGLDAEKDKDKLQALVDQFAETGKKLSEAQPGESVKLEVSTVAAPADDKKLTDDGSDKGDKMLSEADVEKIIKKREDKRLSDEKEARDKLEANQKLFDKALSDAKGLTDDTVKLLSGSRDLITATMTTDQVQRMADQQIIQGNAIESNKQLSSMGFNAPVAGNIQVGGDQSSLSLQAEIDKALKGTGAFINGDIVLSDKPNPFAQAVLSIFDQVNARQLSEESKILSGDGQTRLDNAFMPKGLERTVIRDVLHDLRILELVQRLTDATASQTTQVPYEVRDADQIVNDGIVFEGQGIPFANVGTNHDLAFVLGMKLALKVTNEVMHFTSSSLVNWNAWGENIRGNVRIMRELIVRRLANEIQRVSDSFEAQTKANEDIAAQLDGTISTIVTSLFPIVRPHQQYNMAGQAIDVEENPITLTLDGTVIKPWDGTGEQTAGTYYTLSSLNLGHIQLVSEAKPLTPVTPDIAVATITYSYATNIVKFDMNFDATGLSDSAKKKAYKEHLNGLLDIVGDRKAYMKGKRYIMPEYLLMSPYLNNEVTKATEFIENNKRNGTDTTLRGDLQDIKNIPAFGTDAPGIDLGDERIHMGQRGTTTYTVVKPFTIGQPFQAVDNNGKATGEQMAYGEEYSAIYTPKPIRNRATGVIVFDSTKREIVV